MADVSYRVWFGCRINGVEYERGELVTLDSANAGVQAALNHPGAPRIRVNDGGAGGTPDDGSVTDVKVAADAAIAATKISGTALVASTVDAKGDLYVGTAADAVGRLAAGTNTHVLTADSTTGTGLKWAAPAASGATASDVLLLMGG